ncbi:MAG: DUF4215 domain-containing protein, partial [Myxococcota bacterium]|nr:DUF4215 domain-containing protein [Myxococcota bacterium]
MNKQILMTSIFFVGACGVPSLPIVPAGQGGAVIIEGLVEHGVDGVAVPVPWPHARVELSGLGSTTADENGYYRLPSLPSVESDRMLEFLVYDPLGLSDEPPTGNRLYALPSGVSGQVNVDLTVGARGGLSGRIVVEGKPHSGGVIVYAKGVPGADDLSGPDGSFYLHGLPQGRAQVGFIYQDFSVAPSAFVEVDVLPYVSTELETSVQLSAPVGEAATASISGRVILSDEVKGSHLELVVSPLLGRVSETMDEQSAVKIVNILPDGSFDFPLDYHEPHTLTLRSRSGGEAFPIRVSRHHHVVPGTRDLIFYAQIAGLDRDGDGYFDAPDQDGDGLADEEDDDADGDGCLGESELTASLPFSCGDFDGDGLADGFDPDDDGDGHADLEELSSGADGRTSNHRNGQHFARSSIPGGQISGDGTFTVLGAKVRLQPVDEEHPAMTLAADHHSYFGNETVTGLYRISVPVGATAELSVQIFGYRSFSSELRLVVIPDCALDCTPAFYPHHLPGALLSCSPSERGRQTCPEEPYKAVLNGDSLIWLQRVSPSSEALLCGNGQVDPGEACDDGNRDPNDGCDSECRSGRCGDGVLREGLPPEDTGFEECDDGNAENGDSCLNNCRLSRCGDAVLRTDLRPGQDGFESCDDANTDDRDACLTGCSLARCGDGVLRRDVDRDHAEFEACDDGNDLDDDNCLSNCVVFRCGDGVVHGILEGCDDGNDSSADACLNNCAVALCGDGVLRQGLEPDEAGFESCDDGNIDDTDGCLNRCSIATCGDGVLHLGVETCDDGNNVNTDACLNVCQPATCGDGFTRAGLEQCDDANGSNQDACLNSCVAARCGDGFRRGGVEACDDGDGDNNDTCLNNCNVARCGDAVVQTGVDLCDDGNDENRDGCGNNCKPTVRGMALNSSATCLLRSGGVWCMGNNNNGNLGNGSVESSLVPALIPDLNGFNSITALSAGESHVCALKSDGTVFCWGRNANGQLGDSSTSQRNRPVQVSGLTGVLQIITGAHHSCALLFRGRLVCWGYNDNGALGTGNTNSSNRPVAVSNLTGAVEASAGAHTCARVVTGEVYCWGFNGHGAVGDGSSGQNNEVRSSPRRVQGLTDVAAIV